MFVLQDTRVNVLLEVYLFNFADNWSFSPGTMSRIDGLGLPTRCGAGEDDEPERYLCVDEDADIDESGDSDEADSLEAENQKQVHYRAFIILRDTNLFLCKYMYTCLYGVFSSVLSDIHFILTSLAS